MEENTIIKVNGLSKEYLIGHQLSRNRYSTFRDAMVDTAKQLPKKIKGILGGKSLYSQSVESFWALNDLSFEVKRGDALGILGRNGAGKSTLLKVLSRITEPTAGTIDIYGRIASLLEVGTGFHPELTGRENIFLNGAILGMSREEIKSKFDEIVAFAGVEQFLDTPVKRYSSGMYVRLAFAVAAHLDPEVLVVDEVLAVGDAEFQKKCLGKMNDIVKSGERTVLFVSHNMASLLALCNKGIVLDKGKLIYSGSINDAVNHYLHSKASTADESLETRKEREGNQTIKFSDAWIQQMNQPRRNVITPFADVELNVVCRNRTALPLDSTFLKLDVRINDILETKVTWLSTDLRPVDKSIIEDQSVFSFVFKIKNINLRPGQFNVSLFLVYKGDIADWIQSAFDFEVTNVDSYGNGKMMPTNQGLVMFDFDLELEN
ncbi:MAG TPA: ABC transporter ATP-binding protein [Cyclobacteriaceae bacterium]|jgi:lipopolysaccharide transport system ATP-binding protein|nr:ABC transporter ATP-binding protein [Cyclobacteriaceae bacterium]